jgi:hypothetical protein
MNEPLRYATADTPRRVPMSALAAVEAALALAEAQRLGALALRLLAGAPACLLPPLLLTWLIRFILLGWGVTLPSGSLFLVISAVVLPILFWRSSRHRTDFFADAARNVGVPAGGAWRAGSYGEWEMRSAELTLAGYAEVFFWGPNIVLDAIRAWRARSGTAPELRRQAAPLVLQLMAQEKAAAIADLAAFGAPLPRIIRYLEAHDWIGIAAKRDRIWLLTDARQRLAAAAAG